MINARDNMVFQLGQPAWNKGLLRDTNESVRKYADKLKGNQFGKSNKGRTRPDLAERNKRIKQFGDRQGRFKKGNAPWNKGFGDYIKGENNPNWNGGCPDYRYPKREWNITRKRILERDNFICKRCSIKVEGTNATVDHKIPWNISQDNSDKNLQTLCRSCNITKHFEDKKKYTEVNGNVS